MRTTIATPGPFSAEVPTADVDAGRAGPYVDHCEGMDGYLRPVSIHDDGHGGVIAEYNHRRCGARWNTSWAKEGPSVNVSGPPEPARVGTILLGIIARAGWSA